MAKTVARGSATRGATWDSAWSDGKTQVLVVAGDDGQITGTTAGGDTITVVCGKGTILPILWTVVSVAPPNSVVVW